MKDKTVVVEVTVRCAGDADPENVAKTIEASIEVGYDMGQTPDMVDLRLMSVKAGRS